MFTVIRPGLLIDGTGAVPVRGATLVIEGTQVRDVYVGERPLPDDARVVDASSCTVIPGLIDAHVHLNNPTVPSLPLYRVGVPPTLAVLYGLQAALSSLAAGFTSLRTMGGPEYAALRQAIDAGLVPGPRVVVAGMVCMSAGHTDRLYPTNFFRSIEHSADGADQVRQRARRFLRAGVDSIKVEATGGMIAEGDTPDMRGYTDAELVAAAEEAHAFGKRLAVHAHSAEGVRRAIAAGADTIEHCTWADEAALEMVAAKGAYITATCSLVENGIRQGGRPGPVLQKLQRGLDAKLQMLATSRRLGVKVAMGTDACGPSMPHGKNALELELLYRAGFTSMECLMSGTKVAAEAIGLGDLTGTLEPGKRADLLVLACNPLDDITALQNPANVLQVFKDGQLVVERLSERATGQLYWAV